MRYTFRCVEAGAPTCMARLRADSEEELRAKLIQHLSRHGVARPNETLLDYLLAVGTGRRPSLRVTPDNS